MFPSPKKVTPPAKGVIGENPWNGGPEPAGVDGQRSFSRAVTRGLTREQLPRQVKPSPTRAGHSGSSQTSSPPWSRARGRHQLLPAAFPGQEPPNPHIFPNPHSAPPAREGSRCSGRAGSCSPFPLPDPRGSACPGLLPGNGTAAGTKQGTARALFPNPRRPKRQGGEQSCVESTWKAGGGALAEKQALPAAQPR